MPVALPTQVQAVVFDGVTPAYRDLRTPASAIFPWLINFIAVNGSAIDMSGTSGTVTWTANLVITSASATVFSCSSTASTTAGSLITFTNAANGQVQVLVALGDCATLSALALTPTFLEYALYITDQFGNKYKAVYGMIYPSTDSG